MIFVLVAAVHALVRRAEETEALARQRGIDLAKLAQLNEYIIQNLRESIVVVDPNDRIRLINQSAAEHLGTSRGQPDQQIEELSPALSRLLANWRAGDAGASGMPPFIAADGSTQINSHMAPLDGNADGPVLIFLEDASLLAQKVQQSKLAALGRLSASIAHEIRNPVGAISHAGQLLGESDLAGEQEQRLLDIIQTNSNRVSEIIDNVMQLSRRETTSPELLQLENWCRDFVAEFTSTLELFEGQVGISAESQDVEVRMDPSHLRQVVWNLCENALKYASEAAGGISVQLRFGRMPSNRRPFLEVSDYGPGIPESLNDHIFEPFATGRTGGTGLGLFISRELCECNRAALLYEKGQPVGSIFRIIFADPGRWEL
jgi:two-component system sensor histidine kinase PilS (NtrC family)